MIYKDYSVDVREEPRGQFVAKIRRLDGKKIKITTDETEHRSLETKRFFNQDGAIKEAKAMIDGGGMK